MEKYLLCGIDKVRNIVFVKYFTHITCIYIHISCDYSNISVTQIFVPYKLINSSGYLCQLLLRVTQTVYMNELWYFFKGASSFSEKRSSSILPTSITSCFAVEIRERSNVSSSSKSIRRYCLTSCKVTTHSTPFL